MMASVSMPASQMRSSPHHGVTPRHKTNCCRVGSVAVCAGAKDSHSGTSHAAMSLTAGAAASALLAKVTALVATAGIAPGVLQSIHQASMTKPSDNKTLPISSLHQAALASKVPIAAALAPSIPLPSLPADWHVISSAADWFDQNQAASATGALLATVFISDKAATAHSPLLERLRRNYGTGPDAPVLFVFVHIGPEYDSRQHACTAAAGLARGPAGMTLARLSHTAAMHGLDVALSSFLPDTVRAFPSLLLTAGPTAAAAPTEAGYRGAVASHWGSATRVGELTQLVSDWAFISRREATARKKAAAAAAATPPTRVVSSSDESGVPAQLTVGGGKAVRVLVPTAAASRSAASRAGAKQGQRGESALVAV